LQADDVDHRQPVGVSGARFGGEDDQPQVAAVNGQDVAVQRDGPDVGMTNRFAVFPLPGHGPAVPQVTEPAAGRPKISDQAGQPPVRGILPDGTAQVTDQQGLKMFSLPRRGEHVTGLAGEMPPDPVPLAVGQAGRITQEGSPRGIARQHGPGRVVHGRRHVREPVEQPLGAWADVARDLPGPGRGLAGQNAEVLVFRPGQAQRAG
jgi:hypothetical protein